MKLIRVAAGVLNQTPLDWVGNQQRIIASIQQAREADVSILCLPELCISGYGCEDAFHSPETQRQAERVLGEVLPHTQGMIVSLGLPVLHHGSLYNAACLIVDGRVIGFVGKQNLAGEGIHYEPRWFKPWPEGRRAELDCLGQSYPLGDYIFDIGDVRIGFEICEDAWVAQRPGGNLARRGVDLILNPSASHFAFGKHEVRKRFVIEGARAFQVAYVYSNLLGNEAGRAIYDGDAMIASGGRLLTAGPRFSYQDTLLTSAVIDVDLLRTTRSRTASYRPIVGDGDGDRLSASFTFPTLLPEKQPLELPTWEASPQIKEEEFTRAVALGLFDYMRKSRSSGFVVSMSGGADSAAVSVLASKMIQFGLEELGPAAFQKKLSYVRDAEGIVEARRWVERLLVCVYQSTRNSGEVTRTAAREVSLALGAQFLEFDVDPLVQGYIQNVSQAIGRELSWQSDDIALQNIQARTRSPGVWLLTNIRGALLLSTSNRSEAAVGYATMDGDTSGGLSPIAGIDKAFLRHWLRWMESQGPQLDSGTAAKVPALNYVNAQQPTAELRPATSQQTDEGDLMPYDLLDAVERLAIRDKLSPREVFYQLRVDFAQYGPEQLVQWIERFFRLWCRNQWKRERYAPSFHLDDENLDPKTWCRFPILSGGYDRELADLRQVLAEVLGGSSRPK